MTQTFPLGAWFGLKVSISLFSLICFMVVIPLTALLGRLWLALDPGSAWVAGSFCSLAWFLSDYLHQCGHALAARRVGYPMTGIHFHSVFSASLYPADEPPLPARIHIARALGGFWVNVLIGALLIPAAINLWPMGGVIAWVTAVTAVWNLFILGLGALLPIDIPGVITIDGGTIRRYLRDNRHSGSS